MSWRVRMGGLAIVVVAAIACTRPPPPQARPPTRAEDIVASMIDAYGKAASYEDRGVVTTKFSGSSNHSNRAEFDTSFVREQGFRHESRDKWRASAVWMEGGNVRSHRSGGAIEDKKDFGSLIRYSRIPELLLPTLSHTVSFDQLAQLQLRELAEQVDGHPCYVIAGTWPRGERLVLWIDRDNYLLRKSVASTRFEASIDSPAFDSETTTTYLPTLNQQVAASRLRGPEPKRIPPPRTEAWLGVVFAETGTRIARVLPGAAADRAGVQVDDEILSLDGTSTADASAVIDLLRRRSVGASMSLEVRRAGSQRVVKAELTDRVGYFRLQTALLDKTAPSFAVTPVNNASQASLATLAGRLIVLDFTPPSFVRCENCESPQGTFMNKLQEKYGARGLQVVGVSSESASALQKVSTDLGLRYPLAHDENARIANAFFVVSPMTTIVIDKKGIVRFIVDRTSLEMTVQELLRD
jgi:peroxiredoxin